MGPSLNFIPGHSENASRSASTNATQSIGWFESSLRMFRWLTREDKTEAVVNMGYYESDENGEISKSRETSARASSSRSVSDPVIFLK